jgi:hypothetical protein
VDALVASSIRDATGRDAGGGAAACRRPAPSCPRCCGRWETFLYTLKAGPAGGRLRRPSSRRQRHAGHRAAGLIGLARPDDSITPEQLCTCRAVTLAGCVTARQMKRIVLPQGNRPRGGTRHVIRHPRQDPLGALQAPRPPLASREGLPGEVVPRVPRLRHRGRNVDVPSRCRLGAVGRAGAANDRQPLVSSGQQR